MTSPNPKALSCKETPLYIVAMAGTQPAALLNPIIALHENNCKINAILLYVTDKILNSQGYPVLITELKNICPEIIINKFSETGKYNIICEQINTSIKQFSENNLDKPGFTFILNGGTNIFINAFLNCCRKEIAYLIYSEREGILIYTFNEKSKIIKSEKIYVATDFKENDILKIHNIEYENQSDPADLIKSPYYSLIKKYTNLAELKSYNMVKIGNSIFDHVFILPGNYLTCIKFVINENNETQKNEARKILDIQKNREAFKGLYDRKIILFTDSSRVEKRMKTAEEQSFKLQIININSNKNQKQINHPLLKKDKNFYTKTIKCKGTHNKGLAGFCFLSSNNPLPSFNFLWTIKPENMVFFITSESFDKTQNIIDRYHDLFKKNAQSIPSCKIILISTLFSGESIIKMDAKKLFRNNLKGVVNITPGTKSHTLFLNIIAKKNNYDQCYFSSFTTPNALCYCSDDKYFSKENKTFSPSPDILLSLLGYKKIKFRKFEILRAEKEKFSELITFMTNLFEQNKCPLSILRNGGSLNGKDKKNISGWSRSKMMLYNRKGNFEFKDSIGIIFEKIICFCIEKAGVQNIMMNLEFQWSDSTPEANAFEQEIDIVCCLDSEYIMISCKAKEKFNFADELSETESIARETTDIKAGAARFGNFTLPAIISFLNKGVMKSRDVCQVPGALLIGPDIFLYPNKLRQALIDGIAMKKSRNL